MFPDHDVVRRPNGKVWWDRWGVNHTSTEEAWWEENDPPWSSTRFQTEFKEYAYEMWETAHHVGCRMFWSEGAEGHPGQEDFGVHNTLTHTHTDTR